MAADLKSAAMFFTTFLRAELQATTINYNPYPLFTHLYILRFAILYILTTFAT